MRIFLMAHLLDDALQVSVLILQALLFALDRQLVQQRLSFADDPIQDARSVVGGKQWC